MSKIYIPDSDDEQPQLPARKKRQREWQGDEEAVFSDDEDNSGPQTHRLLPKAHVIPDDLYRPSIEARQASIALQQQRPNTQANMNAFSRVAMGGKSSIRLPFHLQRSKPRSVAGSDDAVVVPTAATATPQDDESAVSHRSALLPTTSLNHSRKFKNSTTCRGPAFIGKQFSAKPDKQQQKSDANQQQQEAEEEPNQPYIVSTKQQITPTTIYNNNNHNQDKIDQVSQLAVQKTADGLNVVFRSKKQAIAAGTTTAAAATDALSPPSSSSALPAPKNPNTGWGNNFVRINLKKGKGSTSYKPGRNSFRKKKRGSSRWRTPRLRQVGDGSEFLDGWTGPFKGGGECYKCGALGHWAKDCPQKDPLAPSPGVESSSDDDEDDHLSNTDINSGGVCIKAAGPITQLPQQQQKQQEQDIVPAEDIALQYTEVAASPTVDSLTAVLQDVFGHTAFRGLQLETIHRVLKGESCLSIQPTGAGKSLCYQLPALLLPGLTLVISPLIALMLDQCASAPQQLSPAVLWSGQSRADALQVLQDVKSGRVKLLFVSPERLQNRHLIEALQPHMPLALVVVDEAHCVAEWGHSFRPAYFRLGTALVANIKARSVLALTATATRATELAVCSVLSISSPNQVLRDSAVRPNLRLHVKSKPSTQGEGPVIESIKQLLVQGGKLAHVKSAIVYCCFKEQANQISKALTAAGIRADAYHAGKSHADRSSVEKSFSSGRLRVCCATVAFGMGIDLSSVEAVIHATMPRSMEEYVQQIGRAGRDGSEASCYVFLDAGDFRLLRSLAHTAVVDSRAVAGLLDKVLDDAVGREDILTTAAAAGKKEKKVEEEEEKKEEEMVEGECWRTFGVLSLSKIAAELDIQPDTIEAVLSYLDAASTSDADRLLQLMPSVAVAAKVSFYAATPQQLAISHPIVAALLKAMPKPPRNGLYTIPTGRLAAAAQIPPGQAISQLQELAASKMIGFDLLGVRDGVGYELLRPELDKGERERLAGVLLKRLQVMQGCQVGRLDATYRALQAALQVRGGEEAQEGILRDAIDKYFQQGPPPEEGMEGGSSSAALLLQTDTKDLPLKQADLALLNAARAVLRKEKELGGGELSARAVARILHGIRGGGVRLKDDKTQKRMGVFWGSWSNADFAAVLQAAEMAIRELI